MSTHTFCLDFFGAFRVNCTYKHYIRHDFSHPGAEDRFLQGLSLHMHARERTYARSQADIWAPASRHMNARGRPAVSKNSNIVLNKIGE